MDDLVEEVCWEFLGAESVGRIGFTFDGLPWILPVNFRLLGRTLVFRTAIGSMLDALEPVAPVVLLVDHLDQTTATGWSDRARPDSISGRTISRPADAVTAHV